MNSRCNTRVVQSANAQSASANYGGANSTSGPYTSSAELPRNIVDPQLVSDKRATEVVCGPGIGTGGGTGSCCAVAANDAYIPGTITESGACQTTVQQDSFANWGAAMPNTYLLTTSGPMTGVTMGGCNVRPITSAGITNYTGFWNSCEPKAPAPHFGRTYSSKFGAPNHSSCG